MAVQSDDSEEDQQSDSDSDEIIVKKKKKPGQPPASLTKHENLRPKPEAHAATPNPQKPLEQPTQKQAQPRKRKFVDDSDDDESD